MSAAPPGLQQDGPNPLELFFEKNKKWIYTLVIILVAFLAGKYGLEKLERAKKNQQWREFTAATGLSTGFGEAVVPDPQMPEQYREYFWTSAMKKKQRELVTKLMNDVGNADVAKIDAEIDACVDDVDRLPWLIWVAANKLYAQSDWEGCRARCQDLKTQFADHFLTTKTEYPVQVREEEKKKKDDQAKKKDKKPELEPVVAGSPVDNLLAAVANDEAFRKANPHFFEAPKPDAGETAVFTLTGVNLTSTVEIEIAFFSKAAPKHVAAFKKSVADGYYHGMRIHKIKRKGKAAFMAQDDRPAPTTVHLGHPNSKDDDRDKWKEDVKAEEKDILEFEAGMNDLSFFPFMVAAEQEEEGKSSARRFFICANDCAERYDGDYTIFGRVTRGTEYITDIASRDMADVTEDNAGEGRPADEFKIEKTELRKK